MIIRRNIAAPGPVGHAIDRRLHRDLAWLLVVAFILTVLGVTGTVMIVNGAARGFGL